ncbi:MAG: hypothetical protein QF412_02275 [Planctomycetota bacterium]|nr:hypothetical protein [Planctomycetota bacterium]
MTRLTASATSLAIICVLAGAAAAQDESVSAELRQASYKTWNIILPAEKWLPVDGIKLPHAGGEGFRAVQDQMSLEIDTNADGKLDQKVKGTTGYAVFRGKYQDGSKLAYAVRFFLNGAVYSYAMSGAMVGSIDGVSIKLIDQNANGRYDEFGKDAMIVGSGNAASFLSRLVNLKGKIHELTVSPDGRKIEAKPYQGETGSLSVRKGFKSNGKLLSAVVSNEAGDVSFNLAGQKAVTVPVGNYRFSAGLAKKGGEEAELRPGDMKPLAVTADNAISVKFGAPLKADFHYTRDGTKIDVQPNVRFLGSAGEEWLNFRPDAKSPKLTFHDAETGKLLTSKRFDGC